MIQTPQSQKRPEPSGAAARPAIRRGTWLLIGMVALACAGLIGLSFLNRRSKTAAADATDDASRADSSSASQPFDRAGDPDAQSPGSANFRTVSKPAGPTTASLRQSATNAAPAIWSGAQPTAEARDLVSRLLRLDGAPGGLTPERAAAWTRDLQQLAQQGEPGVAAIRELLTTGTDREFGDWGRTNLGFSTARLALIDTLAKSGSASAQLALSEALQSTLEPAEVGTLLRNLETLAPGQYREQALEAARQALAAAEKSQLPDRDLAPAFVILQKYGGAEAVADLDRLSGKYSYYSAIALSQLSDGAGLPQLIAMARGEGSKSFGTQLVAQQTLASLAPENPAAREALLESVRTGQVVPGGWSFLASALEGRKFGYEETVLDPQPVLAGEQEAHHAQLLPENQRYFLALDPAAFTPEWAGQQLGLIDQLLAATKDPAAVLELQRVRETIQARQQPAGGPGRNP